MPYPSGHRERVRARIVDAARRLFNREGFEQVSIDRIMAAAGLTRGGFYHHFKNKDALYAEAVGSFRACSPFARRSVQLTPAEREPRELARLLVDMYLSDEVLADPDQHCPLYALPSDVARAGPSPQKAYTELIRRIVSVQQAALEGQPDAERHAQAIVALCVGGMLLARTTHDPELGRSVRAAARQQALMLLG